MALCFSGWLNVSIPGRGSTARTHLLDIVQADVFLAATFLPADCPQGGGGCLLNRVEMLQPLTSLELKPMLTREQLLRMVGGAPHWHNISANFKAMNPWGLSIWNPVLGNRGLSVLRELHDYSRVIRMVAEHERWRGVPYSRIIFSRLEFHWYAPHPPLSLMEPSAVWLPYHTGRGLFDRHAVLNRSAAEVYFKRFEMLISAEATSLVEWWVLRYGHPEDLLLSVLQAYRLPIRHFPQTAALACCSARCYTHACESTQLPRIGAGAIPPGLEMKGKYLEELKLVSPHVGALACPGARYGLGQVGRWDLGAQQTGSAVDIIIQLPSPRAMPWSSGGDASGGRGGTEGGSSRRWRNEGLGSRGSEPLVLVSTPLTSPWVQPVAASRWHERQLMHAMRRRGGRDSTERVLTGALISTPPQCPMQPRHWLPRAAVRGYCEPTESGSGDCRRSSKGSFLDFQWHPKESEVDALGRCLDLCAICDRCRFVSLSLSTIVSDQGWDCSWFFSCDLSQTKTIGIGSDYSSFAISDAQEQLTICRESFHPLVCPAAWVAWVQPRLLLLHAVRGSCHLPPSSPPPDDAFSNCDVDSYGRWPRLFAGGVSPRQSLVACVAACMRCSRCHYASLTKRGVCAWYHDCELDFSSLPRLILVDEFDTTTGTENGITNRPITVRVLNEKNHTHTAFGVPLLPPLHPRL